MRVAAAAAAAALPLPGNETTLNHYLTTQTRIVREDGIAGLFRGGGPTVVRAMALNMGMLASNDQAKEMIEAAGFAKGGSAAVLGGASIAGVCVCVSGGRMCVGVWGVWVCGQSKSGYSKHKMGAAW